MRRLLTFFPMIALLVSLATLHSIHAQDNPGDCPPPTQMGELTDILSASGTWTADECDSSQFLPQRPGQMFEFTLPETQEVRIDLRSPDRDALVYLLAEDGTLVESNDDTGDGNNARIERKLPAGTYRIEASTLGWSGRESGSFELTVRVVEGCLEVVDLGLLEDTLNVDGEWSHFGCESIYRPDRAGQRYRFELSESRRVQIDLTSELADAFMYLHDQSGVLVEADDDGGVGRNSRIERVLGAGVYTIEATNWDDRDSKGLATAAYELTVAAEGVGPVIKLEQIDAPEQVIKGIPFQINYRVSNLGDEPITALDPNPRVQVRLRWPYVQNWRTSNIAATGGETELWGVGDSYHSSEDVQAFGSQALPELQPFEGLFRFRTGPTDVYLQLLVINDDFDTVGIHWLSRPIMVLSGYELDPISVSVDDVVYQVSATADETGEVTVEVSPESELAHETTTENTESDDQDTTEETSEEDEPRLDPQIEARAIYAAGVRSLVLDDLADQLDSLQATVDPLYEHVERGGLPLSDVDPAEAPTLDALVAVLSAGHLEVLDHAAFDPAQFLHANNAEAIVVRAGRAAAQRIEQFIREWGDVTAADHLLTPSDALAVQSQLALATEVDTRIVEAAVIVLMKNLAEDGWEDSNVAAALSSYAAGIDCAADASALSFGDQVLRNLSTIYGSMLDSAYCGAVTADQEHSQLLTGLNLESNPEIPAPEVVEQPAPTPPPVTAQALLARVLFDGRVEFAVDLSNGERILPGQRTLPVDVTPDAWLRTGPVMAGDVEVGRVYARRLGAGLVQATFVPTGGDMETTARWVVPENAPTNAWLISGALDRAPDSLRDDLIQRIADQAAGAGSAQFGDHLTLLSLIENNLQRNP